MKILSATDAYQQFLEGGSEWEKENKKKIMVGINGASSRGHREYLCSNLGIPSYKMSFYKDWLRALGYKVSEVHFTGDSVRTVLKVEW